MKAGIYFGYESVPVPIEHSEGGHQIFGEFFDIAARFVESQAVLYSFDPLVEFFLVHQSAALRETVAWALSALI